MLQTLYGYWFLQFDFPDKNGQPYRAPADEWSGTTSSSARSPQGGTQ